ncbi:MAG: YigZ family protein, partial [Clostridiales bacterium]
MTKKIVLAADGVGEFSEKKSKFIAYCTRADDETAAQDFIAKIKKMNRNATHNVYAYIVGEKNEIERCSDDGEPSGTAGSPVLEMIKGEGLSHCAVVVTRYFGGILLGTGGLVRAYGKTAQLALENTKKAQLTSGETVCLFMNYELLGKVEHYLMEENRIIDHIEYQNNAAIFCLIPTLERENFCNIIKEKFPQGVDFNILKEKK